MSPDLWEPSNHAPLSVCIIIKEEFIQDKKLAIVKNSKKEKEFVNKLRNKVRYINITNIYSHDMLKDVTQEFASITEEIWYKHTLNMSTLLNTLRYSGIRNATEI